MCLAPRSDLVTACGLPIVELASLFPTFPRQGHKKGLGKMVENQGNAVLVRNIQVKPSQPNTTPCVAEGMLL